MIKHKSKVKDFWDVTGLWLCCDCGWETSLGDLPSVEKINKAWQRHISGDWKQYDHLDI